MPSLKAPLSVQYELTWDCPHACLHCYNHYRDAQTQLFDRAREMNWPQCQYALNALIEAGVFSVILTGGEPLKRRDIMYPAIEHLRQADVRVSINTSGIMLKKDDIIRLEDLGVSSLLVSCPSMRPEVYQNMVQRRSFDHFLTAMDMLAESHLRFTVNMVVNRQNLSDLEFTASSLQERFGCQRFSATPMSLNACHQAQGANFLNAEEVTDMIRRLIKIRDQLGIKVDVFESLVSCVVPEEVLTEDNGFSRRSCTAGRTVATLAPDGNIRPCSHAPMSYGNILQDSLEVIWQKMAPWRRNEYVPDKCLACSYLERCRGGCRISAMAKSNGDIQAEDPWMQQPLKKSPPTKKATPLQEADQLYRLKEFLWRQEGEKRYLIFNIADRTLLQVNEEFFFIVQGLKDLGPFIPQDLARQHGYDEKSFYDLLGVLWQRKILTRV